MLTLAENPTQRRITCAGRSPHAVVIGSGFGGLAAAVRLGARGYRVTVLEDSISPAAEPACSSRTASLRRRAYDRHGAVPVRGTLALLRQRALATTSTCAQLSRSTAFASTTARRSTARGDAERCAPRWRGVSPGDVDGYERFMRLAAEIYRIGFEQLGHVPFSSWTDMAASAARTRAAEELSQRPRPGSALCARPASIRFILSFHPLFVGGNPFTTTSIYSLIPFLERRWGVHFPMGGMGALVQGLVDLIEGQGGRIRYRADVAEINCRRPGGNRRAARRRRDDPRRHRRLERGFRLDLPASSSRQQRGGAGPTASSTAPLFDGLVRLVLRHLAQISRMSRTTPSCSGRAIASC